MQTSIVNVKVNPEVKKKAQQVAADLGLSLSALINGYLRNLIKTKVVHFDLKEEPSEYLIQSIKEAEEDIKAGRLLTFKNLKDSLGYLDKIIENEEQNKKN